MRSNQPLERTLVIIRHATSRAPFRESAFPAKLEQSAHRSQLAFTTSWTGSERDVT